MQKILSIFIMILLFACAGCVNTGPPTGNESMEEKLPMILYYENGSTTIPINLSDIDIKERENFTANLSSVISILLDDPRTGILLKGGWTMTSATMKREESDPDRTYVEVEFQKDELSFFIGVDEQERRTLDGYCGAEYWYATPISGPLPEGYHQALEKSSRTYHVFDQKNERVALVYNKTTIFYLYPSYAVSGYENINED